MIKLKIEPDLFYKELEKQVVEGTDILVKEISNPVLLKEAIENWEGKAVKFLKTNIQDFPEQLISDIEDVQTESIVSNQFLKQEFKNDPNKHITYLTLHLERKIAAFKIVVDYLSLSDIITGKESRTLVTIQEKILFVLEKLYQVFNDNFYSVSIIFKLNGIGYRENEPLEIAENLRKRGYGIRESNWSSKDLLKISIKGAAYIERKIKGSNNKTRKQRETEINSKIDSVLQELEKLGYGQEIIFKEIEELRGLSKKLNKKTWSQLIKGKVVDLALSNLINIDTAKFVYESLVDEKFKLLK